MQDDLTDAVEALANEGKIDPKNVCIVGGSYGGYAALAGAAFTPDVYKCAISLNGVSDLDVMMKTERSSYGSNHWVVAYWDRVMANGNYKRNYLASVSPINFVSDIKIPVLLIHGEYDEIVPFKQSKNMYETMKDEDKDVTFIELNNGDHFLSTAENRIKAMKAMSEFLDKHL
jgi:dipeptidyl aminopeptidase/acylaminoacyl peptidase